jgi:hypothetical protein
MPTGVGFPIGFESGDDGFEYYFLEVHLNNPESQPDISVQIGVELYHTSQLL